EERFFLVIAAELADWTLVNEPAIKGIALFESRWAHASRRADAFCSFFGVGDNKRTIFAAQKAGGVKGFEFLTFAEIEALADVDECWDSGISGSERSRNDGANVRRGDGLRRSVARVPLVLMA